MDPNELGRVEKMGIREQWKHEANDFTPWLAKDKNIQILSDEIGIDIEVQGIEVPIGSFIADIIGRDEDGRKIIIENQLSKTDHKHLGQLITYASGVDAKIQIWICKQVTEEHRRAIDWLNEFTTSDLAFFACEIELWKIGNSVPAPMFNVVSSPNDWSKTIKTQPIEIISDTKKNQLEFWNGFKEFMTDQETDLRLRTPRAAHYYSISLGTSYFGLCLTTNTMENRIGCEIYIGGKPAKKVFSNLFQMKEEIENELGPLNWLELPEKTACRIITYRDGDIKDKDQWPDLFDWLCDRSEAFRVVFSERVKKISAE